MFVRVWNKFGIQIKPECLKYYFAKKKPSTSEWIYILYEYVQMEKGWIKDYGDPHKCQKAIGNAY